MIDDTLTAADVDVACQRLHSAHPDCLREEARAVVDQLYPEAGEYAKQVTTRLFHMRELERRRREALEG